MTRQAASAIGAVLLLVAACADSTPPSEPTAASPSAAAPTTTVSATTAPTSTSRAAPSGGEIVEAEAIFDAVHSAFEASTVPGAVVVVIRDGEMVASISHGTDPATGDPIRLDELFQVASISKSVTAMGVAVMVEQGVLNWDDDVRDRLTSFTLRSLHDEPVTFAQLLSHTGGTTVDGFLGYPADADVPAVPVLLGGGGNSAEVFVEGEPGSGYSYSGGGYTVVQQAMVDMTGVDFATLLDELVLEPAGTVDATYAQPLSDDLRDRASAASIGGDAVEPFVYPEQAAAGLWASGLDLARLLIEYQAALAGNADWLGAQAAAFLIEPTAGGIGGIVGHGFFVSDAEDPEWFWHQGRNTGFSAEMIGSVDGRHGVVVLTNALEAEVTIRAIVDAVKEIEGWEGLPR